MWWGKKKELLKAKETEKAKRKCRGDKFNIENEWYTGREERTDKGQQWREKRRLIKKEQKNKDRLKERREINNKRKDIRD